MGQDAPRGELAAGDGHRPARYFHVGVCAPTYEGVRAICFEGEAGIIAEARRNGIEVKDYNKNRLEILIRNESKIRGFSAEKPDSIRGENLSYCWFDELAVIRYMTFYHEGLMPALRKGENPRMVITTTPKRIRLLRDLLADGENEAETDVHVTRGLTAENPHFASGSERHWNASTPARTCSGRNWKANWSATSTGACSRSSSSTRPACSRTRTPCPSGAVSSSRSTRPPPPRTPRMSPGSW